MSNRKKLSEEEIRHIGFRIRSCRVLTGLTQEDFGNSYGFPVPSLKTWEFGAVIPRLDGLKKYCQALRSFGLFVTTDWLLFGDGTGPTYYLEQRHVLNEPSGISPTESGALKEVFENACRKNKENAIVVEIDDDEMAPYYCCGDTIGGILLESGAFQNTKKPVLVRLNSVKFAPRFLHVVDGEFFICSIKTPAIEKIKLESFGFIKWYYSA